MRNSKKVLIISIAFLLALCLALCACVSQPSSSEWVKSVIDAYYYTDVEITDADSLSPDEMVSKYLDKYSRYYTAEEFMELSYENAGNSISYGMGMVFYPFAGAVVISCTGNSPAWKHGVRAGDIITYAVIDGERVMLDSYEDYMAFINGSGEGKVSAYILSDGTMIPLESYSAYKQSYVLLATASSAWTFTNNGLTMAQSNRDVITYLPEGTAYLSLNEFSGDAAMQFKLAVEKINALGCDRLILDLRSNPGGDLNVLTEIAGCFPAVAGKEALSSKGKAVDESYSAVVQEEKYTLSSDTELFVMANSQTASASEALIGALVGNGALAYENIFLSSYSSDYMESSGEGAKTGQTYGKGCMQYIISNTSTGEALSLTAAILYWPNGKCINDVGITAADGCRLLSAPYPSYAVNTEVEQLVNIISSQSAEALAA